MPFHLEKGSDESGEGYDVRGAKRSDGREVHSVLIAANQRR